MTTSDQRRAVIDAIAADLAQLELGHPVRVAVDGITGAGKTTFANQLADAVRARDRACLSVTMDGFHHPRATRYRQGRASADGYYEDAYDFAALRRELLDPLGGAGDRRYRTAVIDLAADEPLDLPRERAEERLVVIVDGSFLQRSELDGAWDVTVFLRSTFAAARARGAARDAAQLGSLEEAERMFETRYHAAQRRYLAELQPERRADTVIEHHDPQAPVIERHRSRADRRAADARAFFAARADGWNERFAADEPAFRQAIAELGLAPGSTVVDVGCGAGRAFADLGAAVGSQGLVVGIDVTIEMLRAAGPGVRATAVLVLADAQQIPMHAGAADGIFSAGFLGHLSDPLLGLVELARVTRPGGRLAIFHPVGRAALAQKHRHPPRPDDPLDPANLPAILAASGWRLISADDAADRYLALATRDAWVALSTELGDLLREEPPMDEAATRSLLEAFGQAWNDHDLDRALEMTTEDCVFESTGPAPDGVRSVGHDEVRAAWGPIFADDTAHFEVEELVIQGDRATQRWTYRFTDGHVRGVDLFAIRDGLVSEKLSYVKG